MKHHSLSKSKVLFFLFSFTAGIFFSGEVKVFAGEDPVIVGTELQKSYGKDWKPKEHIQPYTIYTPDQWEADKKQDKGGSEGGGTMLCTKQEHPSGLVCAGFPTTWQENHASYELRPYCQFSPFKHCETKLISVVPTIVDCLCVN